HLRLILLCLVVAAAAATGFSLLQTKEYTASASLLFRNPGFAEDVFGTSPSSSPTDPTREAATNQQLVGMQVVAGRTAKVLGGDYTEALVHNMVAVSSNGQSEIVSITATSQSPAAAQEVANTFARQFIAFRADTDKSKLLQAKDLAEENFNTLTPVQQEGVRGQSLSRAAERLGVLASLQTGNAELVQPATEPTSPSSPKPLRNGFLGAIFGLLLGIGLAFLFDRLGSQFREPEEIRDAFELPVLSVIPDSARLSQTVDDDESSGTLPFAENEAFRTLRAALRYFNVDTDVRSVMVVSHEAQAGKSTVAWNLARAAAASSRAIIVETDLRASCLAHRHRLRHGPGLAEVLTGQASMDEAIQSIHLPHGSATNGNGNGRTLDVMVGGATPPNPSELLESHVMQQTLAELSSRYDFIVLDTAPLGVVSDAYPLVRRVDGVIIVSRIRSSRRDAAERLRERLAQLRAPLLGVVVNGGRRRKGRYGYGQGYYGDPEEAADARTPAIVD
ncbi:MAG TPA: polysaccharide biosynthesis tyrosine autokinase, partial [Solirubrobacterales bacterium]|nr:polysaccharide biosynthesis tyrosine autokinase [Solirubrobacterales bacterium]